MPESFVASEHRDVSPRLPARGSMAPVGVRLIHEPLRGNGIRDERNQGDELQPIALNDGRANSSPTSSWIILAAASAAQVIGLWHSAVNRRKAIRFDRRRLTI